MAEFVSTVDMPELPDGVENDVRDRIERLKSGTGGEKVHAIRTDLQEHMMNDASVFRTEESLASVQRVLGDLKSSYDDVSIDDKGSQFNYDLTEAMELGYLLDLAESLVVSARARTESRGAHYRDDHPLREDDHWMKHTLAYRESDGTIRLD
jgi:succinate dehydrogenase / fumarate reductase flavoprotein subunit